MGNLASALQKLAEFDRHYERKENLLFPFLEKYEFSGPSAVMWGIHDDIRKAWKRMRAQLQDAEADPAAVCRAIHSNGKRHAGNVL